MVDALVKYPELEMVDGLIAGLEALLTESDETPLHIEHGSRPKRATYRILSIASPSERRVHQADAVYLDDESMLLRCQNTQVVRQTVLEVTLQAEKTGRGEVTAIIQGKVRDLKRIRGGYDIDVAVTETRKHKTTTAQKLRDCIEQNDSVGWNRWCQDIDGTLELVGMDLRKADLTGFDLCCADLDGTDFSGANLSGAILAGSDLTRCALSGVQVTGTDFFHARMTRNQASLLQQSGMPEVESVVFETPEKRGTAR